MLSCMELHQYDHKSIPHMTTGSSLSIQSKPHLESPMALEQAAVDGLEEPHDDMAGFAPRIDLVDKLPKRLNVLGRSYRRLAVPRHPLETLQ
jgi:hypothetical protein